MTTTTTLALAPWQQQRWQFPAPAFPDDHDTQSHCIDASVPVLAGAPFLSFFIFLSLTPSITQWWLQWWQQWPAPASAYCHQRVTTGKYTFYYYLWFFFLIRSNDDSGLLLGTNFPWQWPSSPSNFQGDDDSPSLAQWWCWELVKQYLANCKKHYSTFNVARRSSPWPWAYIPCTHFSYFDVPMYLFYCCNWAFLPIWTKLGLTGILEWIVNRCVQVYFSWGMWAMMTW